MVSKVSAKIADKLYAAAAIAEEDKELYSYGFFVLLSRILFFGLSTIFGIILHIPVESIIFFVLFSLIRSYAGGVHASSELKCTVYTTSALLICILCIKFLMQYDSKYVLLTVLIMSLICILVLSPLDSLEKPLTKQEKSHYRKITWIITGLIIVLTIIFYLLELKSISISCVISLVLESILMITGKVKNSIKKTI